MCDGHQAPLRIHLFQIPEMKSSKAHIVFDVTEDGLDFHRAFGTQFFSKIRGEILPCLFSEFDQAKADLYPPIALGLGTLRLEWTVLAFAAFIMPALTFIAIGRLVLAGVEIAQSLFRRTNELIAFGVILEMIRAKLMFANDLWVAIMMGVRGCQEGCVNGVNHHDCNLPAAAQQRADCAQLGSLPSNRIAS